MTSPFIPSSFQYNDAPQGGNVMPMIIAGRDPSDTIDSQYAAGYLWLSSLDIINSDGTTGTGSLFVQSGNTTGSPNWSALSAGSSSLNTLSDGSNIVSPSGSSNIALEGTLNQITTFGSNAAHTITFSIPTVFIAPGSIKSTSTLEVGTNLTVDNNATVTGDLLVSGDAHVVGNLLVDGTITFAGLSVDGTVAINTAGAGTTTIGNAAAGAITFDVGTGDFQINGGGNEIHIGDDAAANTVVIGSNDTTSSLHLQAGTGDVLIDGSTTAEIIIGAVTQTGLITLGRSTAGEDISIGSAINASAQVIDIANGASAANSDVRILSGTGTAGAATILLGNNPRVTVASLADVAPAASRTVTVGGGTVVVAAVTDTIDIGPDGATTNANSVKTVNINTGGVTLGQVLTNIATGAVTSGTHTTSIATGNRAAGTMLVNLLTGTGTKSMAAGNADGLTTFGFKGPYNVNVSQNNNTAINSGTSTGTVTIGNTLAGAVSINSSAASNFTVTGAVDLTLASTTGAVIATSAKTAATAIQLTANGAGGGITMSADTGGILPTTSGKFTVISTDNAAQAIELHANGGVTETIRLRADQGTSATSLDLLSDVGGITLNAGLASASAINITSSAVGGGWTLNSGTAGVTLANTGKLSLAGAAASDITITGAFDLTLASTLGRVITQSAKAAADAVKLNASNAAGGITMTAGTGNINMTGNIIQSTNPCFFLRLNSTQSDKTGTGTAYTLGTGATLTVDFDRGSNATTSGVFTAPVTGIYDLRSQVTVTGTTIATTFVISIVATGRTYTYTFIKAAGSQDESVSISALVSMTATDTAHVTIAVTGEGGDTDDILGAASAQTYFCGCLVG